MLQIQHIDIQSMYSMDERKCIYFTQFHIWPQKMMEEYIQIESYIVLATDKSTPLLYKNDKFRIRS